MKIRYQIRKQRINTTIQSIILHPLLIGDAIHEFDTIEECELEIEEIKNMEMYSDVVLSIKDVYYTD